MLAMIDRCQKKQCASHLDGAVQPQTEQCPCCPLSSTTRKPSGKRHHFVLMLWLITVGLHVAVMQPHISTPPLPCLSGLCSHLGSPGRIHTKSARTCPIQIYFCFIQPKNLLPVFIRVFWRSLILQFFDHWCLGRRLPFTLSHQLLKHQLPQLILVLSQKHIPVCFSIHVGIFDELCMT